MPENTSDQNLNNLGDTNSTTTSPAVPPNPPDLNEFRSQIIDLTDKVSALQKALESERKITKSLREEKKLESGNSETGVSRESLSILEQQIETLRSQSESDRSRYSEEVKLSQKKIEELKNASKQKDNELIAARKQLTLSKIKYQFSSAARTAGVKAPYIDLLFSSSANSFQLNDDGAVVAPGGVALDEYLSSLRESMPEIFPAPSISGTGAGSGNAPESSGGASIVSRDNFLNNLDAIISGDAIVGN